MRNIRVRVRQLTLAQSLVLLDYLGVMDRDIVVRETKEVVKATDYVNRHRTWAYVFEMTKPIMFVGGPTGTKLFEGRFETFLLDRVLAAIITYGEYPVHEAFEEAEASNHALTVPF